jgi:arylsulfatase A-like enzyme
MSTSLFPIGSTMRRPARLRISTGWPAKVRFDNAVCATPFCSPTRASFLTGVYPHSHGITKNVGGAVEGLDPDLPSTDQALFDAGHTCRQFGKWRLGDRGRQPAYRDQPESNYRDAEDRARGEYSESMGRNGLRHRGSAAGKPPANRHSIEAADRSTAAFRFGQLLGEDGMRISGRLLRACLHDGLERGPDRDMRPPAR